MYAFSAIVLSAAVAIGLAFVAYRSHLLCPTWLGRLERRMLHVADRAVFPSGEETLRHSITWLRAWLATAAVAFLAFSHAHDGFAANDPSVVARVVVRAGLALVASGLLVYVLLAAMRFVPDFRSSVTLRRCGFRGLWVLSRARRRNAMPPDFVRRMREKTTIDVVDVTGYELFVRGAGERQGVLASILEEAPSAHVRLALFNPMAQSIDPDSVHVTTFQSVLAELGLQAAAFVKRVRETLGAVDALNAKRSPGAQIEVRFYDEKPSMRAIMGDDAMLVTPWSPRSESSETPCLEVVRDSDSPSFYETFRRHFARVWSIGISQTLSG